MEPYERVMAAINHRVPDRPPINYLATPEANANLKKYLGINEDELLRA